MEPEDPQSPSQKSEQNADPDPADLQSPITLAPLDTPASQSSLLLDSPSPGLANRASALSIADSDPFYSSSESECSPTNMKRTFRSNPAADSAPASPAKERSQHFPKDTPQLTGSDVRRNVGQAITASKRLQQVVGIQKPEPFKPPPYMPPDLVQAFEDGMEEFGIGVKMEKTKLDEDTEMKDLKEEADEEMFDVSGKGKGKAVESIQEKGLDVGVAQNVGEAAAYTPTLFPSPSIGKETQADAQFSAIDTSQHADVDGFLTSLFSRPPPTADAKVASAPTKSSRLEGQARKRARAESQQGQFPTSPLSNPQKKARSEDTTGLQTLPASQKAAWQTEFPGNQQNLASVLLNWHHTMRTLYRRCGDDSLLMEVHPVFPYPPTPLVNAPLVSISFWDTSTEPHQELRFIGPSDVASILYAEVDTFKGREEVAGDEVREAGKYTGFGSAKHARMLMRDEWPNQPKNLRKVAMHDRNAKGEGRWCFVVIYARKGEPEANIRAAAPWVTLAWPTTAVTKTSECLHTILPEEQQQPSPASTSGEMPPPAGPGFFDSPEVYEALRSATSETLPAPSTQKNAITLRRTTLHFQKAGGLPLVEGYRTDVGLWRPFLEAVGSGQGKILMFAEAN